jgi:hypothetical protein
MEYEILVSEHRDEFQDLNILMNGEQAVIEGIDDDNGILSGSTYTISSDINVNKFRINIADDIIFDGKISLYDPNAYIMANNIFFDDGSELINSYHNGKITISATGYIKHDNSTLYCEGRLREEAKGQDPESRGLIFEHGAKSVTRWMLFEITSYRIDLNGILDLFQNSL